MIFVFNNAQVVSVPFEKVYRGVDFLVLMHVLDLHHKHKTINVDCLFAQNIRFSVIGGGRLFVDKEYLLSLFLTLFVVLIEQQRFPVDHLPVIYEGRDGIGVGETVQKVGFVAAQLLYFLDLVRRFLLICLCLLHAQFHAQPANHIQADQGQ